MENPFSFSPTCTSQISEPVLASRDTRCASSVPRNKRSPNTATPRFVDTVHSRPNRAGGRVYCQMGRPVRASKEKLKRAAARMTIELAPNPDILAGLTGKRRNGQVFVGFALETSQGVARARAKLVGKGLDLVVLNAPKTAIGSDTNQVTLVEARGVTKLPTQSKREVAEAILDRAIALRGRSAGKPTKARPKTRRAASTRVAKGGSHR